MGSGLLGVAGTTLGQPLPDEATTQVPRILVGVLGSLTVVMLFLVLFQLGKNKELIKARLFLLYDRIYKIELVVIVLAALLMGVHLIFAVNWDPNFVQWDRFLALGIYAVAFYAGALAVATIVFLLLYPVGRK